ncbi:hypothetical protein GCM10011534_33030 [Pseudooceanicola nanhaiensis]|jgi:hypothetical protein|uniref:Uncharacterized protein n=1 Tax=Pseudooceanicola nanhaiensis TaxID=375761 RepID=A0A917T435_9RHOB|nr:hypothetical protein [Pseudooceanicola nanhaiensis]GGM08421.1 hypothetical protein GCM10011534_33030 [Pseudooceanicola nanhaiensis]
MAEVGKKKITVDTKINLYGEAKGKEPPAWFAASPALQKLDQTIDVKRTLELDPRKWNRKTLEDGAYAVARYELALFATAMAGFEKKIVKALPKDQKRAKLDKNAKSISDDFKSEFEKVEGDVVKLHKKITKAIEAKVSTALDEVEADKGDNKKALAAGKEALKKFAQVDDRMFSNLTEDVADTLKALARDLKGADEKEAAAAYKDAKSSMAVCQKAFASSAKEVQNVAKYLLFKGDKMARDKNAAPALQEIGKKLSANGPMKSALNRISAAVDDFGKSLDDVDRLVSDGKASEAEVKTAAQQFEKDHKDKDKTLAEAARHMDAIGKAFNKTSQQVKA